jgi:N-acetylglucosamine malate deacetylase 2
MRETLLRRPLVLVAHQDDEAIACAILLQRAEQPTVVFATNGAPADPYFWSKYGSPQKLAEVRRHEAMQAIRAVGVAHAYFLDFPDQQLHLSAAEAIARVSTVAQENRCSAIVTHAYEGGHPDHDTCSYIAHTVGESLSLDVWEMPLYHRAEGRPSMQQFLNGNAEVTITPSDEEYARKQQMMAAYPSQGELLRTFTKREEVFRRQPHYDYARPPHEGQLNYEAWQWQVTGKEVSSALSRSLGAAR